MNAASDRILPAMPVGYVILHQSLGALGEETYAATLQALHGRLAKEAAAVAAAGEKARHDLLVREAQALLSSLNQFLETPLKRDQAEVERIVVEGLERVASEFPAVPLPRLRSSVEGRLVIPSFSAAAAQRAAARATAYLRELGFSDAAGGDVYESVFIVDGGAGLDLLEHCVRDRIGIYDQPHGAHIQQAANWIFSAYNLVYFHGNPDASSPAPLELCLHLTKSPSLRYDDYREEVSHALDALLPATSGASAGLWQRKLGLGRSREFILRIRCADLPSVEELASGLLFDRKSPEFGESGNPPVLLLKELLS